jgi:hypothetical protein
VRRHERRVRKRSSDQCGQSKALSQIIAQRRLRGVQHRRDLRFRNIRLWLVSRYGSLNSEAIIMPAPPSAARIRGAISHTLRLRSSASGSNHPPGI